MKPSPSRSRSVLRRRAIGAGILLVSWAAFAAPRIAANSASPMASDSYRAIAAGEAAPARAEFLRALPGGALYKIYAADETGSAERGEDAARPLFLLQSIRGERDGLARDPSAWGASRGVRVLWTDATFALVDAPDPRVLDAITAEGYRLEALDAASRAPAPSATLAPPPAPSPRATLFEPAVDSIVARVHPDSFYDRLGALTGAESTLVGGAPYLFRTRYTHSDGGRKGEQWCFETLAALGLATEYEAVPVGSTQARNVIATLPGLVTPERIYIIGGHLDSTSPQPTTRAPGAEDNGSGAIGVIEAARVLRDRRFNSTIKFICFTGEEQGLYGSTKNASNAAARGDSIFGVVNMDMIGWVGTTYKVTIEGQVAWESLMTVMDDACARYTPLATEKTYYSFGSDHVPYQTRGYAAFLAIEDEYDSYPCYHQTCDTAANVSRDQSADIIRAGVATVAHLAHPVDFAIVHTPLSATPDSIGPYVVGAHAISAAGANPDSVRLYWSNGGAMNEVVMTPGSKPDEYFGEIPGQPSRTIVYYYIAAADSAGLHATNPDGAPPMFHSFAIGSYEAFYASSFDDGDDGGWTHEAALGIDDWQRAAPASLGGDPAAAYSAPFCWGTDLSGSGTNLGKYENNTRSVLTSPVIDCSGRAGVRLSFERWLGIERHNLMQRDIASVIVNADTIWRNPSGANVADASWQSQAFDISAIADDNPAVRIQFALKSDGATVYCGWNIDDVRLEGVAAFATTGVVAAGARGDLLVLWPAAPNPFNPSTTIRFRTGERGPIRADIFDAEGRLVRTLFDGATMEPGTYTAAWNGRDAAGRAAASGVYFLKLRGAGEAQARKLVLVR